MIVYCLIDYIYYLDRYPATVIRGTPNGNSKRCLTAHALVCQNLF